jgi:hypothetical protein
MGFIAGKIIELLLGDFPRLIRVASSCFPGRLVDNTRSGWRIPTSSCFDGKIQGFPFQMFHEFPNINSTSRMPKLGSPDLGYRMTFPVAAFCYQDLPCELMATQQTPNSDRCSPANLQGSCLCCCFFDILQM